MKMFFNVKVNIVVVCVLTFMDVHYCQIPESIDENGSGTGDGETAGPEDDLGTLLNKLSSKIETLLKGNDPYKVSFKPLDFDSDLIKSKGYVEQTTLSDISKVNIRTQFTNESNHLHIGYNVASSSLMSIGTYKLDLNILEQFFLQGQGNFGISLAGVNLMTNVSVRVLENETLQITKFDFKYDINRQEIEIEGLFGGGAVGKLVKSILNSLISRIMKTYKRAITAGLSMAARTAMENSLSGMTVQNVTDVINGIISG